AASPRARTAASARSIGDAARRKLAATSRTFHCRELVMGRLHKGEKVRVRSDFQSDDESPSEVSKGMTGRVIRIDQDGDAFIKFWQDEYDDDFRRYWVHRPTFWEHLEVPGRMAELRAAKVVSCMNNCTLTQECRMQEMSRKEQKAFQKCMKGCKMDECNEERECKIMMEAYSTCKQRTAQSRECDPEQRKGKGRGSEL
ncbi:unnamed protein product, partial [Prorocentrum cordatum]